MDKLQAPSFYILCYSELLIKNTDMILVTNYKTGITRIKCDCSKNFYMTYNYMSDAVSFK